jgi:putative tryptophan/tyrosine transport system substrate-binding protein
MRRRDFIGVLGGVAAWPVAPYAQGKVWRIGFLSGRSKPNTLDRDPHGALLEGMRQLGYTENKDYAMEWRFAAGDFTRLPALAADLVQSKVDVIVTSPAIATRAAQQATSTIPIVFAYVSDPVASGLVASLPRPGGNITGLAVQQTDIAPKQLQLLKQILPQLSRVAVLSNPTNAGSAVLVRRVHAAVEQASMTLLSVTASTTSAIEAEFAEVSRQKADALISLPDPFFASQRELIARIAVSHQVPAMFGDPDYVEAGGFISYGDRLASFIRQTAYYVDQIIKGAKAADLPVQQPTKFELAVNLKAAQALGLKVPDIMLAIADQVIE